MDPLKDLSNFQILALGLFATATLYLLNLWVLHRHAVASIGYHPGARSFISKTSNLSFVLPPIKWINEIEPWKYEGKYKAFEKAGMDIVSGVGYWPRTTPALLIADPAVIKDVSTNRTAFPKPSQAYEMVSIFGMNIVAAEAEVWRRHRKIAAPSFSEKNNVLVYEETKRIVLDMFDLWKNDGMRDVVQVDDMAEYTFEIALQVIASAGFGYGVDWKDDTKIPQGYTMTFKKALNDACNGLFKRGAFSDSVLQLTAEGRRIKRSYQELERYMHDMVKRREEMLLGEDCPSDLFTNLLKARNEDKGSNALSDSDLVGNIFILYIAGHETTAHTMGFALAALALYPEMQAKAYAEIRAMVQEGQLPAYSDVTRFNYIQAVIYEALRMFPIVGWVSKESEYDTTLRTTDKYGAPVTIPCPAGTRVDLSVTGLHYNPKYWVNPEKFNPDRFLGDWNRDAFIPFSVGARACLGRRFAEIEAMTTLALILSTYEVFVSEEPQFVLETFAEKEKRLFDTKLGLTLTPTRVPLTFRKRA